MYRLVRPWVYFMSKGLKLAKKIKGISLIGTLPSISFSIVKYVSLGLLIVPFINTRGISISNWLTAEAIFSFSYMQRWWQFSVLLYMDIYWYKFDDGTSTWFGPGCSIIVPLCVVIHSATNFLLWDMLYLYSITLSAISISLGLTFLHLYRKVDSVHQTNTQQFEDESITSNLPTGFTIPLCIYLL